MNRGGAEGGASYEQPDLHSEESASSCLEENAKSVSKSFIVKSPHKAS